ncbi:MAG TPA: hypothetical protein VEC37_04130 [Bacillota bacterium]|nr:hypothetical protein [Bacillota bacterium]
MDANAILQTTLVILILLGVIFNNSYSRHKTPATPYEDLRTQALGTDALSISTDPTDPATPFGAIMEIGFPGTVVTLVTFNSGKAALHFSNGENVTADQPPTALREAALAFVQKANVYVAMLQRVDTFPLPRKGSVRFYVLTQGGIYSAELPEKYLQESASTLTELYEYGHNVIYQLGKLKHSRINPSGNSPESY